MCHTIQCSYGSIETKRGPQMMATIIMCIDLTVFGFMFIEVNKDQYHGSVLVVITVYTNNILFVKAGNSSDGLISLRQGAKLNNIIFLLVCCVKLSDCMISEYLESSDKYTEVDVAIPSWWHLQHFYRNI